MGTKDQLVREIEKLPEELIEEVYDFVALMRKRSESKNRDTGTWTKFSLSTGAFDFWNDPKEVEYSLADLKES